MSRLHIRRRFDAAYRIELPRVAHIVAELDDFGFAIPYSSVGRRSAVGRVASAWQRVVQRLLAFRRLATASVVAAVAMAVVACGDSTGPATPPVVARVQVSPLAIVLEEGKELQLQAFAFDSDDRLLTGRRVTWQSDAPGVITVSPTGHIRALAHGYAAVTATIEGQSSSTAITVPEREP